MLRRKAIRNNMIAASLATVSTVATLPFAAANDDTGEYVTAAKVLDELPNGEFVWFVGGIVEGLAYARFRKDTIAAGQRDTSGSDCIREWYHSDNQIILKIISTFRKYGEHTPWVVIAAMVKQECGE